MKKKHREVKKDGRKRVSTKARMPCVVAVMVSAHRQDQKDQCHINRPRLRLKNVNELLKKNLGRTEVILKQPRKGKVVRTRETIDQVFLAVAIIWEEKWMKDSRSRLTSEENVQKGGNVGERGNNREVGRNRGRGVRVKGRGKIGGWHGFPFIIAATCGHVRGARPSLSRPRRDASDT
jgi:hypothetical protein